MTTRTRLTPGERRAQLLDLGAQLFAEQPYDQVRIERVAELAGVSRGLLYHYFPTKRAFFVELLRRESERITERTAPDPDLPPLDQLRHGIDGFLANCRGRMHGAQAVFRGTASADPDVQAIIDRGSAEQTRRILAAVSPGEEPHPLLGITVRSWLLFLRSACFEWLENGSSADQEEVRELAVGALVGAFLALPRYARPALVDELTLSGPPGSRTT
ncbi:TetR/AcrR family transcriptional regulator [Spongisporangium articulatum]|uniref:TetR/AcrR family transcriptional regulator n=1 Tax=Spongisporangium articulatum TaxID=3362603 RepID=A0ABW8AP11_9ACTN